MSDPPLSDIDFKNKMAWVWTTLNGSCDIILEIDRSGIFHDQNWRFSFEVYDAFRYFDAFQSDFLWQIFCDEKFIIRSGFTFDLQSELQSIELVIAFPVIDVTEVCW